MIQNTKCECGHQNNVGTVLCESCGKPLMKDTSSEEVLEMRYDGVARRSQKSNPNWIDKIWNFFSSVKIAVYLIIFTLITSIFGTIYPQESSFISGDPSLYYEMTYGNIGKWYYRLGFSRTYESWWFIGLLVMIGASLVICSLDRVLPLYRALSKQQIRKHLQFITRQKVVYSQQIEGDPVAFVDKMAKQLKKKNYRVHKDGEALLAEKNRFSRWGPYINHIGLIIFLLAVLARSIPGYYMDQYVTIPEGEAVEIKNTNYYIKNEKFTVEYYADDELPPRMQGTLRAKLYETRAVLYECVDRCGDLVQGPELKEVERHAIKVNEPLSYKGLSAYQFDFDTTPKLETIHPVLINKQTGEEYGPFELSIKNPELVYELGPYNLELREQYMEFSLDENGEPITLSSQPNAPAYLFLLKGPDIDDKGEPFLYFPIQLDKQRYSQDLINRKIAERFDIRVQSMENVTFAGPSTSLNIRIDTALPFVWVGATISMIGLVMGFYWHHRRIWLRIDGGKLSLGAHTNKNWYGMRAEVASVLSKLDIKIEPKSLENGGDKK
ncbi:cytochrome c biogenesis protein ResB [Paenibacillaceae bacterium]|nr:cytochrome c biogenesis protein ResB [Paenibacillaceae bacterium]